MEILENFTVGIYNAPRVRKGASETRYASLGVAPLVKDGFEGG